MPNKWKSRKAGYPQDRYSLVSQGLLDPASEKLLASLKKELGIEAAFSDDVFKCANCGHEYVGERLCPECGA